MSLEAWGIIAGVVVSIGGSGLAAYIQVTSRLAKLETMVSENSKHIESNKEDLRELNTKDQSRADQYNELIIKFNAGISELNSFVRENLARITVLLETMDKRTKKLEDK